MGVSPASAEESTVNLLKLSWRNVWRSRRRSLVTIAAMTLALTVELLYSGLVTGMLVDMESDVTEMDSAELQIMHPEYLERPSIYTAVEGSDALLDRLEEAGFSATARLLGGGLAASGELAAGVMLVGVDPVAETRVLKLHTAVGEGQWLDAADPKGVLVGRGLARTLALEPGSELVVLSQAADGSMANALFTVRGVLMSVAAGLDRSAILMPAGTFRELMAMPEGAHKILVKRPEALTLDEAAQQVRALAGPDNKVMTWAELNPILAQLLQGVEGMITFFYLIVYVAVAILILNAMLMAVFERIRELGVLKAIGYSPGQVLGMMVLEALIQAGVALAVGLALAAGPMWYLQTHGVDVGVLSGVSMVGMTMPAVWHGYYTTKGVLVPIIMLFVITLAAVLYPAAKAARIQPVEAMHHQ